MEINKAIKLRFNHHVPLPKWWWQLWCASTHFKDWAAAPPAINFFQNSFWMFVQLLRAIQRVDCHFFTLNVNRCRKLNVAFLYIFFCNAYIETLKLQCFKFIQENSRLNSISIYSVYMLRAACFWYYLAVNLKRLFPLLSIICPKQGLFRSWQRNIVTPGLK